MTRTEPARRVGVTDVNLSVLRNAGIGQALDCRPGDLLGCRTETP
jgi:DNA-binding Xre family transcriptional regulator